jgi:hypothetical protein
MKANFFDLQLCRDEARARAMAIDTQVLYKAVYDRKKREEQNERWEGGRRWASMKAPVDRQGRGKR